VEFLTALWIPILASAAAVWIISAVFWMAINHHNKDFDRLPDEAAFIAAVKSLNIPPGVYGFPYFGDRSACNTPEGKKAMTEGPLGMLYNWRPGLGMGKNMVITFLVYIAVSVCIAYIAWNAFRHDGVPVAPAPSFGRVMQITGTAGVAAYAFAFIPGGVWFQAKGRSLVLGMIDGVVYGLVTGAIFAWRWPAA